MKRICLGIILLFFVINSVACAKTYDISKISQVKLVTEYSAETTVESDGYSYFWFISTV